jgi:hypothetical protein
MGVGRGWNSFTSCLKTLMSILSSLSRAHCVGVKNRGIVRGPAASVSVERLLDI